MHFDPLAFILGLVLGRLAFLLHMRFRKRRIRKLLMRRLAEMENGQKKSDLTADFVSLS